MYFEPVKFANLIFFTKKKKNYQKDQPKRDGKAKDKIFRF